MASQDIFISLPELDALIQALEERYGISTAEFIARRDECAEYIEEDDVFKWDAFIAHQRELRRTNEQVRDTYLSNLKLQDNRPDSPAPEDKVLLAA